MSVIVKPVITEKMSAAGERLNQYGFIVARSANKVEIAKEVEGQYNVSVESVNTLNHKGKSRKRWTKTGLTSGRTNATKKAIVTLAKGDVIDHYANI